MKKYIFTILTALVTSVAAWADEVKDCVIFEFRNGETMSIALCRTPKAVFDKEELVITAEDFEGRYERKSIQRFFFKQDVDGIHAISSADKLSSGDIYDMNGRKVGHFEGSIEASSLPVGVYVVKTASGESFKMLKK